MEPTTTAYGTWSGGRFMHFGETLSEERFIGCIETAYEAGIRTFVTADVYGDGKADELLGQALKGIDRSTYCLVGMIGHDFYEGQRQGSQGYPRFTEPALRGPEGYADFIVMASAKELERCGTDKFDLLMLHNPDELGYTSEPLWQALEGAKSAGLTDRLGIAPGPANGFSLDLIYCLEKFGDLIDWSMLILNPLEPWPVGLTLPACEKHGVKVMARVVDYGGVFHDDIGGPGTTSSPATTAPTAPKAGSSTAWKRPTACARSPRNTASRCSSSPASGTSATRPSKAWCPPSSRKPAKARASSRTRSTTSPRCRTSASPPRKSIPSAGSATTPAA